MGEEGHQMLHSAIFSEMGVQIDAKWHYVIMY